jgi:hypothetical protein
VVLLQLNSFSSAYPTKNLGQKTQEKARLEVTSARIVNDKHCPAARLFV